MKRKRVCIGKAGDPIAACPICNTASVNIYSIDFNADTESGYAILAGVNNQTPEYYELFMTEDPYFHLGEFKVMLSECLRL